MDEEKKPVFCCAEHRRMYKSAIESLKSRGVVPKDDVASFIKDSIMADPDSWTACEDIYKAYAEFGRLELSPAQFYMIFASMMPLHQRKRRRIDGGRKWGYVGIALKDGR
jgi:hypothetical protein